MHVSALVCAMHVHFAVQSQQLLLEGNSNATSHFTNPLAMYLLVTLRNNES